MFFKVLIVAIMLSVALTSFIQTTYTTRQDCPTFILDSSLISGSFVESSEISCARQCSKDVTCISFNYLEPGICQLSSTELNSGCSNGLQSLQAKYYQLTSNATDEGQQTTTTIPMMMCLNGGVLVGGVCQCVNGYIGSTCERLMEDCTEGVPYYPGQDGPFLIQPSLAPGPIWTWCWMDYDYRTYLQQRHYQTSITFDRDCSSYRDGFGSLNGTYNMNFWWGNMNAYYLTNSRTYDLVIQAVGQDYNDIGNIVYTDFVVHSEGNNFAMTYSSVYIIPLANHLTLPMNNSLASSGTNFSTYDSDRDQSYGNCAATHGAGWWFDNCTDCNPNGVLWPNGNNVRAGVQNEFFWNDGLSGWSAWGTSLWFTNPH